MRRLSGVPAVWRALTPPVCRTVPWRALAAGGALGLLLAGMTRMVDGLNDDFYALNLLRAAALAFALSLAFLLDDPARHTTAAVPTPRPARQALRVALVAPVAALWWTAALLLVPAEVRPPTGDITLEAAATLVLTLAASATALRFAQEAEPGTAVAAGLLLTAALTMLLVPDRWAMFVYMKDEGWAASHDRWAMVLAMAVLAWGVCGPEPLRRRVRPSPSGV
ncbi:ABC transporter [Streptomyces sp. HUCO-GS316]|uniref:ABC transporter n=1 Tax=Streptomyces sp. HUCO-GS316 TaxID=2692198 RepID=UPI00301BE5E6